MYVQFGANLINLSKIDHVVKSEYIENSYGFYGPNGFLFDQPLTNEQHEFLVDHFAIRQDVRFASGHFPSEAPPTGKFGGA